MPEPPAQAPEIKPKRFPGGSVSAAAKLDELKKKYRLDTQLYLRTRGPEGTPLGRGPLLDPQVFNKFAELDKTKGKRYLDWMLFQAGGGQEAFNNSRDQWGDNTPEKLPDELFAEFKKQKPDHVVYRDELNAIAQDLSVTKGTDASAVLRLSEKIQEITAMPNIQHRYKALVALLEAQGIVPGGEDSLALEIISHKFKVWIRRQLPVKGRDRVHATLLYFRSIQGIPREESEAKWKESEARLRRTLILGDQDQRQFNTFCFNRHWPGPKNIYEQIYDEMRKFLLNAAQVERYNERVKAYNTKIQATNQTLDPHQRLPLRQNIPINVNIGKVLADKEGNLTYKGDYPSIYSLAQVNQQIAELPLKERVAQHIVYAGPKGTRSRTSKIYSDANLDVTAPLTVAASIHGGHPAWSISDPKQISDIRSGHSASLSDWTRYAMGQHGHFEWEGTQAIPIFFNLKMPGIPKQLAKLLMLVFIDDLTDLQAPYVATVWKVGGSNEEMTFTEVMDNLKTHIRDIPASTKFGGEPTSPRQTYFSLIRSFTKGMNAVREWGREFDPRDLVADYMKYHQEKTQGRHTLGEDIKIRAAQVVQMLAE